MTRPKVPILGEEAPAGEDCVCFGVLGDFISLPSPGNCDKKLGEEWNFGDEDCWPQTLSMQNTSVPRAM
jgi:hypothetical protein